MVVEILARTSVRCVLIRLHVWKNTNSYILFRWCCIQSQSPGAWLPDQIGVPRRKTGRKSVASPPLPKRVPFNESCRPVDICSHHRLTVESAPEARRSSRVVSLCRWSFVRLRGDVGSSMSSAFRTFLLTVEAGQRRGGHSQPTNREAGHVDVNTK